MTRLSLSFESAARRIALFIVFISAMLPALRPGESFAQDSAVAELYSLEGSAEVRRSGSDNWALCVLGEKFMPGDELRVAKYSRAAVQLKDGELIRLGNNASLSFVGREDGLSLQSGDAHFFSRDPVRYPRITTPTVTAAMRGTEFTVSVRKAESVVAVLEGRVDVSNRHGEVSLQRGEQATAGAGSAPVKSVIVSLPETVQWAVHLPPAGAPARNLAAGEAGLVRALDRALNEGASAGLDELDRFRGKRDARFHLISAKLALEAGQISLAERELRSAEALYNESYGASFRAELIASRSLLNLAKGDSAAALRDAEEARAIDGGVTSALSLSYAHQAGRDLESARAVLKDALLRSPDDKFLLTRMSELELSFGDVAAADDLIERALRLPGDSSYTQAIAGFIALFKFEYDQAQSHFERAVAIDSAAGLPRLGLGLVRIHHNDLTGGRAEIQRAAHLEPQNSLFRSYLGKAFYEDEREDLAQREFDEAIARDPNDPTPWLYRAFNNLSENRLVPALQDVEESIDRNQNRAVYRSGLLIDRDQAVRGASLARIFNELGFTEAGRVEAIRSLSRDYTNYSAHRLLSETQNELFLADAAFSERRAADLLSPLSFNLFDSIGSTASLNEYNALFDRDQTRRNLTGIYDSRDDIYSASALQAGKKDKFGYALSASSDFSDGSFHNNYGRDYRVGGGLQYQLDWQSKVIGRGRGQIVETRDDNSDPQDGDFKTFGFDLGYSRQLSPGSLLLFQSSVDRNFENDQGFSLSRPLNSTQIFGGVTDSREVNALLDSELDSYLTLVRNEGQYVFESENLGAVFGAEVISQHSSRSEDSLILADDAEELDDLGFTVRSSGTNDLTSGAVYLYPTIHVTEWLDITAGLAREDIERELREVTPFSDETTHDGRFSPKFGAVITPLESLTLRAAYYEQLRKSSLEDQSSIEPTIVGGINQRFNDLSGSESRNFGAGVDWKAAGSTYIGGEWIRRHVKENSVVAVNEFIFDFDNQTPSSATNLSEPFDNHIEQDFARSYIYQVLSESWVAGLEYRFSQQELTDPEISEELRDQRGIFSLRYFADGGLFLFSQASYRDQEIDAVDTEFTGDGDHAFLVDAGAGYRFPHRKGSVRLEGINLTGNRNEFFEGNGFDLPYSSGVGVRVVASFNF